MLISERTIKILGQIITGDSNLSPHRSGSNIVRLFNEVGIEASYGQGFPSRWFYAEEKIRSINDTGLLKALFANILDPRHYMDTQYELKAIVEHLNKYLGYDGYEIRKMGSRFAIADLLSRATSVKSEKIVLSGLELVKEQSEKCENKIAERDYDGAITNARTMVEELLSELECKISGQKVQYDGDLIKLYKRTQKLLNIEPSRKDISDTLKQVLSGFVSIVSGISGMRNKMSDSHAKRYKPSRHHAKLAINAAKTLSEFLLDTYEYQKGRIHEM